MILAECNYSVTCQVEGHVEVRNLRGGVRRFTHIKLTRAQEREVEARQASIHSSTETGPNRG